MEGYDAATYGDRFADVYDAWYDDPAATAAAVARLSALADSSADGRLPTLLELGVGTGRLALPLARAGVSVTGVDASTEMLARLEAKAVDNGAGVRAMLGDMAGPLPEGPFDVVVVARNTFFNLTSDAAQRACLSEVARVVSAAGRLVIEAFVPTDEASPRSTVEVRSIDTDRVVLFVDRHDPTAGEVWSSFVDIAVSGVTFRPCHLRYLRPDDLDRLAAGAGLALEQRSADWSGTAFADDSDHHVSIYRRS